MIPNLPGERLVELHQEIDRPHVVPARRFDKFPEPGPAPRLPETAPDLSSASVRIRRKAFDLLLQKEVERVRHRHPGHQIDLNRELGRWVGNTRRAR
jgi:hypothetical protein